MLRERETQRTPAVEPLDSLPSELSWSQLYRLRRDAARRLGEIYQLPLAKRASALLLRFAKPGDRVLEIGAGDRRMRAKLQRAHGSVWYESVDVDPYGEHDYRDLNEVRGSYDLVFAFEVAEHIPLDALTPWLKTLRLRTQPGGMLLLSTPNTYYPPAYLRDATHCTPLCYDELAALCSTAGWQVKSVYRIHHGPIHRVVLHRYLFGWLFRMLGLDFARQIVLVAERP